jgi:hypothetical protein
VALEHGMDLREAVEAAAKAVFDEKGFDLVTPRMEQIAYVPETGALVRVPATARRIAS